MKNTVWSVRNASSTTRLAGPWSTANSSHVIPAVAKHIQICLVNLSYGFHQVWIETMKYSRGATQAILRVTVGVSLSINVHDWICLVWVPKQRKNLLKVWVDCLQLNDMVVFDITWGAPVERRRPMTVDGFPARNLCQKLLKCDLGCPILNSHVLLVKGVVDINAIPPSVLSTDDEFFVEGR